jgi:hypothetical protein
MLFLLGFVAFACGTVALTAASYFWPFEVAGWHYTLTAESGWLVLGCKGELPSMLLIPCWGIVAASLVLFAIGIVARRVLRRIHDEPAGFPVTPSMRMKVDQGTRKPGHSGSTPYT